MKKLFFNKNSRFLTGPQKSIFSAASIIMVTVAASRFLGLVRNRILAHYFSAEMLSVYFAAFRIPEVVFEVLVFGTFTSAFIPVFTSYFAKGKKKKAWEVASLVLNFSVLIFAVSGLLVFILARPLYQLIAPGFNSSQLGQVVVLSRILIFAQGFFVLSYFATSVLESLRRFLIPAVAPLFYNLGIILGTVFLAERVKILAPAVGAVFGSLTHFLIQLPLVFYLGFRMQKKIDFTHSGIKRIVSLAFPRVIELSLLQLAKIWELFLSSLVGSESYTYLTFANSLQLLPVSLFGTSIAKASLPALAYQAKKKKKFQETLLSSFDQILFFTLPVSVFLVVLRVPVVRLLFGAPRFGWGSTLQTSYALTAFSLGIAAQSLVALLKRAFYSFQDTKTPMIVSVSGLFLNAILGALLVLVFKLPVWGIALAFSLGFVFQLFTLLVLICMKFDINLNDLLLPFAKIGSASFVSGGIMYFLLKVFDRYVWENPLPLFEKIGLSFPASFRIFVLDTRYTLNLIILTFLVAFIGILFYLFFCWRLKVKALQTLGKLLGKIEGLGWLSKKFWKKTEAITIDDSPPLE